MNFVLINVHSAKNLGDAAIMEATLRGLSQSFPGASITIASNDPESWEYIHKKYAYIQVLPSICNWVGDCRMGKFRKQAWKMVPVSLWLFFSGILYRFFRVRLLSSSQTKRSLLTAFYNCQMVLSCGGGNFYANSYFSPGFIWNLASLIFPILLGKDVILLPQSIGPIHGKFHRWLAKLTFRHIKTIIVRENRSASFLQNKLNLNLQSTTLPDLAFALRPLAHQPGYQTLDNPIQSLNIGLTVIDRGAQDKNFKQQDRYEHKVVTMLSNIASKTSSTIHIFVQCTGPSADQDDYPVSRRLAKALEGKGTPAVLHTPHKDPEDLRSDFREMDLMVGTRMHTGILALSCGIPILLIGYQPKAKGMLESFGLASYCVDITELEESHIEELLEQIIEKRKQLATRIEARYREVHCEALSWIQIVKNQIG